jgi:hypothetical protein
MIVRGLLFTLERLEKFRPSGGFVAYETPSLASIAL